jgi:hypothetical protein
VGYGSLADLAFSSPPMSAWKPRRKACRYCLMEYDSTRRERPGRDWCHDWACETRRARDDQTARNAAARARNRANRR